MKFTHFLGILVFGLSWIGIVRTPSDASGANSFKSDRRTQSDLALIPDLKNARIVEDEVTIPFVLKNNSADDIGIYLDHDRNIDGLAAWDDAGKWRYIQNFGSLVSPHMIIRGGEYIRMILKPGESSPCNCRYDIETLGAVTDRKIFGAMEGTILGTGSSIQAFSMPFSIPPAFVTLPYVDLGEQNYFSISVDMTKKPRLPGLFIPIMVINTSNQTLSVALDHVHFCIEGDSWGKSFVRRTSVWENLDASDPVLKPGESSQLVDRNEVDLHWAESKGLKQGDKLVAVVGGRIAGTNRIFECYSAPFELPALPK